MLKRIGLNLLKTAIVKTKCYNLRLFYFSLYCFLMFGCGKKIQENNPEQEVRTPRLSSKLVKLKAKLFRSGQAVDEEHVFSSDSEVAIPELIKVNSGNAGNQVARLYFNVDEQDKFSFYCNYVGGASTQSPTHPDDIQDGKLYYFDTCYIEEGNNREVNYYPGNEPIINGGNSVLFKIVGADPRYDTEAVSELEVDSH